MDQYADHWRDISLMLEDNYSEYSHDATVLINTAPRYHINTFKNSNMIKYNRVIAYQLEPLIENHWYSVETIVRNMEGADEIWDYDLDNIEVLKKYGINAKHRPCLYSKTLKRIQNLENPDIDILFYGTLSPRRTSIIHDAFYNAYISGNHLTTISGATTCLIHQVWGAKLDEFIARSKIIINLCPYDGKSIQQQTRIFYPLINNKCIISEKCNRNYYGGLIKEFSNAQEMIDLLGDLLTNDKWKQFSNNSFEETSSILKQVLR